MTEAKVPTIMKRLSHNLKRFRKERRLFMTDLSAISGVTRQTISAIEKGAPDALLSNVQRLADALDIDVVELLW